MHLKKILLESPKLKSKEIFKAIETAIPSTAIEAAILKTKVKEKRHRGLPSQLVVCRNNSNELVVKRLNAGCAKKSN